MGFAKEFKEFAVKGNMVDMAIGIVIGAAFGKIVSSLVADIVMPLLGLLVGGVDFTTLSITLREAVEEGAAAITLNYGQFIQVMFDFLIIALALFMVIKGINRLKRKEEEKAAEPPKPAEDVLLLREIRDSLKK